VCINGCLPRVEVARGPGVLFWTKPPLSDMIPNGSNKSISIFFDTCRLCFGGYEHTGNNNNTAFQSKADHP